MWATEIDTTVLSRLRSRGYADLRKNYPNINFTDDDRAPIDPKFPTVFYINISSAERGQTLDGKTVNALLHSVQIEVSDNSQTNATVKAVMSKICDYMKDMRYEVVNMPFFQNTDNVRRMVARFRRTIGANDVI
jgi:hypothetical protein